MAGKLRYTPHGKDETDSFMIARNAIAIVALAVVSALALSGCGRKGSLDTPYEAAVEARKEAKKNDEPLPPEPTPPEKDKRFILDGLID